MAFAQYSYLQVIVADDEEMYHDIIKGALLRESFPEERIHFTEDGQQAIQQLDELQTQSPDDPVVMFLDVRMEVMDGKECAEKIAKSVQAKTRAKSPFMVCCSAGTARVSNSAEECGFFHLSIPKDFRRPSIEMCFKAATAFLQVSPAQSVSLAQSGGYGGSMSSSRPSPVEDARRPAEPAAQTSARDPKAKPEIFVADAEPICHMAVVTNLGMLGIGEDEITEIDTEEALIEELKEAQLKPDRPLVVLVGTTSWAQAIAECNFEQRKPFLVDTSVDFNDCPHFHARIKGDMSSLINLIEEGRRWWLTGSQ